MVSRCSDGLKDTSQNCILQELNDDYTMNRSKNYILWLFVILVYQGLTAQNLQPYQEVAVIVNSSFSDDFTGYQPQTIQKDHGSVAIHGQKPNFSFTYTPDSGFVGIDTLVIEYKDSEDWFRHKIKYLSYVITVSNSVIYPEQDYFSIAQGDSLLQADLLANDSTSNGTLTLTSIPISQSGSAQIVNNKLDFIPDAGFTGVASLQYKVCDSLGLCAQGYASILVADNGTTNDTVCLATKEGISVSSALPDTGYTVVDTAMNGLGSIQNGFVFVYAPNPDFFGMDSLLLEDGYGNTRLYKINVLEIKDKRATLVDDVVYTAVNHDVLIDVQANDVSDNFDVRTLRHPGQGTLFYVDSLELYRYVPPLDIESIEDFEYGLKGGRVDERATATIYINDGHPDATSTYQLRTPINTPLVLSYQLPIDEHDFTLKTAPPIGNVQIHNNDTTIVVGCDSITGSHYIVFTPGNNFLGAHSFTLTHCVRGTSICKDVDIVVTTYSASPGSCYCMDDCVWSGDINYDGRVDMKDLLPLAHHLGKSGQVRNGAQVSWDAQRASSWGESVIPGGADLKHADTDGDGDLMADDTLAIADHYFNEHSMVPQLVGPSRQYAWYLVPRFDTVRTGELAVIDVVFGNAAYPIEDMEGVAYTVNFSPQVQYDSSTLGVTHHPSSFLTESTPFLAMHKQPWYRRVDVGLRKNFRH